MELASPFCGFNRHAARLTLPGASATSRPPLSSKSHECLAEVVLTGRGFTTISWFLAGNNALSIVRRRPLGEHEMVTAPLRAETGSAHHAPRPT
jgi:hypothetical protein